MEERPRVKEKSRGRGMTVIEALMAVILFAILSLSIASLITYGYKSHTRSSEEALATDRINLNIQNMVEELREARNGENGAFPVETAAANRIAFYSDVDGDDLAEQVSYFVESGELKRSVIPPSGEPPVYNEEDKGTIKIAQEITNNEDNPLFRYLGIDPLGKGNNVELTDPLDISRIRLVIISLKTRVKESGKERTAESKVLLRNLRDY